MVNAETLLNQARSWLGKKESDGSHKAIIDTYNAHSPLARSYKVKYTDSWCATFVSACAIKCGYTDVIPTECSCNKMIELFQKIGCWQEDESVTPKAGWIIFYDWQDNGAGDDKGSSEHVGIVESVINGVITVIEGNKSDAVARRKIKVNGKFIRGYGVPKYDGVASTVTKTETIKSSAELYKVKVNTPSGVNCRAEPSTSGNKLTAYANGSVLSIYKESNGWGYTGKGWVALTYCTKVTHSTSAKKESKPKQERPLGKYRVTASALIVRTGPGKECARKSKRQLTEDGQKHSNNAGGLNRDTIVTVKQWVAGWAEIPSGWVSGLYLEKVD